LDLVIAAGGDGTVREVAAGIAGTETGLAIVPGGTGNSSYRELHGTRDALADLGAALLDPTWRLVDLLEVAPTGELSLLGFSVGWFHQVIGLAAADEATTGPGKYALAAQAAAQNPTRFDARVVLDGAVIADEPLGLVAVGGARVRGGVFPVLPDSRLDDGLLDVLVVRACDGLTFSKLLGDVLTGAHLQNPLVSAGRGRVLRIEGQTALPAEVDGDQWQRDAAACELSVAAGALRVLNLP
jgi:diacylglycerol kinase (ATP)